MDLKTESGMNPILCLLASHNLANQLSCEFLSHLFRNFYIFVISFTGLIQTLC